MRGRPHRLDRLQQQYFGPPQHVVDALAHAANQPAAHGYPPFRGLPTLRLAIAERYSSLYGVELDPETEVSIVPGPRAKAKA
jgi:L-glutamine---4-(methylsulfanyl)-2-oxobutanoate aminotransferase